MTIIHRIELPIPFPLRSVNCYYIEDSHPALIDTCVNSEEGFRTLENTIRAQNGSLLDIERIILTHGHTDHLGMAGRIAEISGAEVFIHRGDRNKIRRNRGDPIENVRGHFLQYFKEAGLPAEAAQRSVEAFSARFKKMVSPLSGETLLLGGESIDFDDFHLRVIHTPGHSPGSICLLNEGDGTFFAGDSLLEEITPNPVAEIISPEDSPGYKSLKSYQASLESIEALPVTRILPGHGGPFSDYRGRIEQVKRHHRIRTEQVLHVLRKAVHTSKQAHGMTQWDIARRLFPNKREAEMFLCLSEARGHLEVLEEEGIVTSRTVDGERFYQSGQG